MTVSPGHLLCWELEALGKARDPGYSSLCLSEPKRRIDAAILFHLLLLPGMKALTEPTKISVAKLGPRKPFETCKTGACKIRSGQIRSIRY